MGVDLTRRMFLKGVGITAAGLVLPNFDLLTHKAPVEPQFIVRPIIDYDIYRLEEIIRYDVFDGSTQIYVAGIITKDVTKDKNLFKKQIHIPMVAHLRDYLKKNKIPPSNLKPMEHPLGYRHPEWYLELING